MGGSQDLSLKVLLQAQMLGGNAISSFGSMLAGLASPAGIAVAALGLVVGVIAKSTELAAQYQQSMRMVQALTGASAQQMAQYDAGLKQLAIDSGVAPTKLSQGLYYVISSGYSGAAAMKLLTLSTRDAVIGMTDQKTTASALTTVMQGFNKSINDADAVNGEMLRTVTLGKMSMQDYAGAISKVAVLHAQYHVTLEDTNATLATLTSSGYKSAAIAATAYSQLVGVMDGKTDLMAARIHKLGLSFDETKFKQMNYQQQLAYLNEVMKGHYDQLQNVLGGSKQAASAFTTLETHSQMFAHNLAELSDQQKNAIATQQAWAITQGGFTQTMNRLSAAIQVVGINIGNLFLPMLTALASAVIPVVALLATWIGQMSSLSTLLENRLVPILTPYVHLLDQVAFMFDRELKQATKNVYDEMYTLWGLLANNGMLNDSLKATSTWMVSTGTPVYTAYAHVVGDVLGGAYQKLGHDALTALLALPTAALKVDESMATLAKGVITGKIKLPSLVPSGGIPGMQNLSGMLGPFQQFMNQVKQIFGSIGQFFHGLFQPFIDEWIGCLPI